VLKLGKPSCSASDAFASCISRVASPELRARLADAAGTVVSASSEYEAAAAAQALDQIVRVPLVNGVVTTAEMDSVYTSRMAGQKGPGRWIYDDILASAKGRCPLCAQRAVTTLDHHLPKSHYPALAVAPINLVPSCTDCNKLKLAKYPRVPEEVTLHPYFDNVDDARWLVAQVIEQVPASLRFLVAPPPTWGDLLAERTIRHFAALKLSALYGSEAAEELLNIRHQLVALLESGGVEQVQGYLSERAQSCSAGRLNGWRAAAYEAWAANDWFCEGGFSAEG
jgi:hypothetical protein